MADMPDIRFTDLHKRAERVVSAHQAVLHGVADAVQKERERQQEAFRMKVRNEQLTARDGSHGLTLRGVLY